MSAAMNADGPSKDNRRTAIVLLVVAAAFFLGVIAKVWLLGN